MKARSTDDIEKGLKKLKVQYADATHISFAYRLKNPLLNRDQGYEDDGEIGQGRQILNILREKEMIEVCVFRVRYYGKRHLGPRRFEMARELTTSAIKTFKGVHQNRIRNL